jgi:hypothetical protein
MAAKGKSSIAQENDNQQQPKSNSSAADEQMIQYIVNSLQSDLSNGQEVSASDLATLIQNKFPNTSPDIIDKAISIIMNDAETMKSRVAGTYESGFRLMISARKPSFGNSPNQQGQQFQQQNQQPKQLQKQQPPNNNNNNQSSASPIPQELQQKINALSDSDKTLLQQTAISVVNDMLSQLKTPVDELELENNIASKYGISSAMADLLVEILKLYPEYARLIKPQAQQQQQQQNQNQQQNQQQPPSQKSPSQSQAFQQKAASVTATSTVNNNYKNMSYPQLRNIILQKQNSTII